MEALVSAAGNPASHLWLSLSLYHLPSSRHHGLHIYYDRFIRVYKCSGKDNPLHRLSMEVQITATKRRGEEGRLKRRCFYVFMHERKTEEVATEKYAGRQENQDKGAADCMCMHLWPCIIVRVQGGQISCLAMNNSTAVNQLGCNLFTRTARGRGMSKLSTDPWL